VIADVRAAPAGYADAVIDAIGCTPLEVVSGPTPPPWLVIATVAAPLLPFEGDVRALTETMATGTASAADWCATLAVTLVAKPVKTKGEK